MDRKPIYEELEQRIKELEQEAVLRKLAEQALRESEERYRTIFELAANSIVLIDGETGELVEFNKRAHENLGFTHEEFEKLKISDFEVTEDAEEVAKHIKKIIKEGSDSFETKHRTKSGEIRDVEVRSRSLSIRGKNFVQSIWRDITDRNRAEEALLEARNNLKTRVEERTAELVKANQQLKLEIKERRRVAQALRKRKKELKLRTSNLEEVNSALTVLLKRRDEDKTEVEERVLLNVKELVVPYAEKLKKTSLEKKQIAYLNVLESNLNNIISPFTYKLSSKYLGLTPKEIHIANLVRDGKTAKEIAGLLNVSVRTIESHRKSIRAKIGLKNSKVNLRSRLLSM